MTRGFLIFVWFYSASIVAQTVYNEFKPGQLWLDDKGNHITMHVGGIFVL